MLRVNASDGRTVYALTYALPAPFVFEDRLVRVADLDRDGWDEVFVVRSSPEEGARLAVYRIDVRNGKLQLTPTAAALAIADAARQMERGADSLAHALAVQGEATTGSVRITTSQVTANYLLPEVLAALQAEEPGIAI